MNLDHSAMTSHGQSHALREKELLSKKSSIFCLFSSDVRFIVCKLEIFNVNL